MAANRTQSQTAERGAPRYDLVNRNQLKELASLQSNRSPILSLFLQVPLSEERKDKLRRQLNHLIHERSQASSNESKDKQRAFKSETDRLMTWLEREYDATGRGLAVFSSSDNSLWRVFRLPMAVRDQLIVSDRPCVTPLMMLADEYERYLVLLIDQQTARLFVVYLGEIEEYNEFKDELVPKPKSDPGESVDKLQRRHEAHVVGHVKHAIQVTERYWQREPYDWLIIGGTENPLAQLRERLPKALRDHLAGEIVVPVDASAEQVLQSAANVVAANERRVEAERVDALLTSALGKGPGVIGLSETLQALVKGDVLTLVVEEDFQQPGFECPNCHFMVGTHMLRCPLCGTLLEAQGDIVERTIGRALDQNARIEIVRGPMRQQLGEHGHIGALLRYPSETNEENSK